MVDSGEERRIVGMISLDDLLHARARNLSEERSRERVLHIRFPFRGARKTAPVKIDLFAIDSAHQHNQCCIDPHSNADRSSSIARGKRMLFSK